MKKFSRIVWATCVLGGLLSGVQALTAQPPEVGSRVECYVCACDGGTCVCQRIRCV